MAKSESAIILPRGSLRAPPPRNKNKNQFVQATWDTNMKQSIFTNSLLRSGLLLATREKVKFAPLILQIWCKLYQLSIGG